MAQLYSENMGLQDWMVTNPLPAQPLLRHSDYISQSLGAQLERQRQELDCFLQFQKERQRWALQHHMNQQEAALGSKLAQATKRAMVLQECITRAEMERERWRKVAEEKEAMVVCLSSAIERVKVRAEDAESFCCEGEEEQEVNVKMACKSCNTMRSSVLFLPCRHLCSCKSCEAFLGYCPVCKSVKEASIEVFLGM